MSQEKKINIKIKRCIEISSFMFLLDICTLYQHDLQLAETCIIYTSGAKSDLTCSFFRLSQLCFFSVAMSWSVGIYWCLWQLSDVVLLNFYLLTIVYFCVC